jgi:glycosyltransferase involved in cell wall biosynthesis
MLNDKSGLIISDTRNSAISTSSRVWADKLNADIIYALEFPSLARLIKAIDLDYDWVFFTWRGSLETILKDRNLTSQLNKVGINTALLFSVPDHIDLSIEGRVKSNPIYEYADGFTVVSRRLQNCYADEQNLAVAPLFLPDFPNTKLVEAVRKMNLPKVRNSIIWVGISRWGESLGFQDHKGYISKLRRIIEISAEKSLPLSFTIIDRGKAFVPHRSTMMEIAKSTFLLQASASEGTGLPVLEALGLGTYPLTTDVGINREIFGAQWQEFDASTPQEFLDKISSSFDSIDSNVLVGIYSRYIAQCSLIVANFKFPIKESFGEIDKKREKYMGKLRIDLISRVQWPVRFLLNKLRTITVNLSQESRE